MYNLYLRVTDEVCYIGKLLAPSNVFPPEQTVNKENENKQALGVLSWQHTREMKSGEPPRDLMERDKYMFDPILIVPWITRDVRQLKGNFARKSQFVEKILKY